MKKKSKEVLRLEKKIKHWESTAEKWRDYARSLETQYNDVIEELRRISVGFTFYDQPASWSQETKLQDRASKCLKKQISKKPKEPEGYFYP